MVFQWPGLGQLILQGIDNRDYSVVQGTMLLLVSVFVLVNLLVDLSYGFLDPRIRYDRCVLPLAGSAGPPANSICVRTPASHKTWHRLQDRGALPLGDCLPADLVGSASPWSCS